MRDKSGLDRGWNWNQLIGKSGLDRDGTGWDKGQIKVGIGISWNQDLT